MNGVYIYIQSTFVVICRFPTLTICPKVCPLLSVKGQCTLNCNKHRGSGSDVITHVITLTKLNILTSVHTIVVLFFAISTHFNLQKNCCILLLVVHLVGKTELVMQLRNLQTARDELARPETSRRMS